PTPWSIPVASSIPAPPALRPVPPATGLLLLWTPGGLPDGLEQQVAGLPDVAAVTMVRSDLAHLVYSRDASGRTVDQTAPGFVIPLEVMAVDPSTYASLLPPGGRALVEGLGDGEALLGSTSADLRRRGPGGTLGVEGETLSLVGVLDDLLAGAAEAVVDYRQGGRLGVTTPRYLLVAFAGDRSRFEAAVRDMLPDGLPVRVRGPGETPYLRHGDAVLPQALIKEHFGEFSYRPGEGRELTIEREWAVDHIITAELPIIGTVHCHRAFLPALEGALTELEQRNLVFLLDPEAFRGCWNPRLIAPGSGVSRHAWGVAVDLNYGVNRTGVQTAQDPRLVEVMERWGMAWGGPWLVPDPAHFEYVQPPRP
ncbi:MAG: M15 family metallopeptidase, partial [Acidimicrobiia bacterium]